MEILPELYPLTGLQIGDIQSYVSQAFLYFAAESNRLLILVDNRPWMMNKHSKSAKIWQLMVTKYRVSPFTNTRAQQNTSNNSGRKDSGVERNHTKIKRFVRWFPTIASTKLQGQYLRSVMDLSKTLQGFIVFEVVWSDVHGINYLNELQTETSLALEVKSMKKWEFCSPDQASSCICSWFSGKPLEAQSLEKNLRLLSDLDLDNWNAHSSLVFHQRPDILSEDDFLDVQEFFVATDGEEEVRHAFGHMPVMNCRETVEESDITPCQYSDKLILFRFSDCILPLKLSQIIMSDLRLLTLLEAGLPSWVIFFQSYPLFCHFYRPWMRHVTRTLYILISLVTVIVGFYDLYKNVPLLKETVARISGPLFGWIEGWEMVSRIQYLGTMLFLSNLQKGLRWFMTMSRTTGTLLAAITRPLTGLLSEVIEDFYPLWNACVEAGGMVSSTVWFAVSSLYSVFLDIIEFVVWPFELFYSYILSVATLLYPFMCSIRDGVLVSIRFVLTVAGCISVLLRNAFEFLKDVWESVSSIFQSSNLSETKKSAYDFSVWQSLWNDLFSQVFKASRSIINGLLAFLMTCNRHRLSTYNHIRAFLERLACRVRIHSRACRCRQTQPDQEPQEEHRECNRCK